jgi:valyl-tRNA synthetase
MLEKQFDWTKTEQKLCEEWQKNNCFTTDLKSEAKPFSIIMPPANVTGSLHLGHALTFTIQDILTRFERLRGKNVLWQPGTDHAGIATQIVVERHLKNEGLTRHDLGRDAFVQRVWDWKKQSGGTIISQLKKLGASADWSRERFTMDNASNKAVTQVFISLYERGLIYKDKRLVNWDVQMQSALSDLEVIQKESIGTFYYIKYPLVEDPDDGIIVATTRPETLFGDQAIAVHPEHNAYKFLIGKKVIIPLLNCEIPIIADDYSDPEKGTGAVKITPAHDFNDFEVGQRHNLKLLNILTPEGLLNENVPNAYQGLNITEARSKVIHDLENAGLLIKTEEKEQILPISDRTGSVIEPYLTDQWFVDAKKLAEQAIEAVNTQETIFLPENWSHTYFEWMKNIHSWCISRQIWWGHQIPAWYSPDGTVFVAESEHAAQKKAEKYYGKAMTLTQETDVLDTWFSSALWPFVTLGWPDTNDPALKKFYPTSVLVTGFDIIFFWVARMMMMGCHFMGQAPFKHVYIHALIRDKNGQKMSKSKGNVIDPIDIMNKYGTDALRFTLASMATPGRDIKFSEEKVESSRNFVTKLWNAARYVLTNGSLDSSFKVHSVTHEINQWILDETAQLISDITSHLESFELNVAAQRLYQFFWSIYCDWYLELTKPLLKEEHYIQETQRTLAWVLGTFLHLIHPFMPFVTEAIWQHMGKDFLTTSTWPKKLEISFVFSQKTVKWLIHAIKSVRTVKAELGINPGSFVELYYSEHCEDIDYLSRKLVPLLKGVGKINSISFLAPEKIKEKKCLQILIENQTFHLPIAGLLDVEAELIRLTKQLEKKKKEEKALSERLKNNDFLAKAPSSIIQDAQEKLNIITENIQKTQLALQSLEVLTHD